MNILRRNLIILSFFFYFISQILAQTEIRKYYANKENDFGIVYTLPKTLIEISIDIEEEKYIPGAFAEYANIYLGKKVNTKESISYKISSVSTKSIGVIDTTKRYLIVFNKNTIAPFVEITDKGVIASINGSKDRSIESIENTADYSDWTKVDSDLPALPDTYPLANSNAQRAFIVNQYHNKIKQTISDIITGDTDNMPKDGESLKIIMSRLEKEAYRCNRLFLGDNIKRVRHLKFYIEPNGSEEESISLLRFSPKYGALALDDLSGEEIIMNLKAINVLNNIFDSEKDKDGIVYNMPGEAEITIISNNTTLSKNKLMLSQFGKTETLMSEMFNTKKSNPIEVYFDVNTGAITKIEQK